MDISISVAVRAPVEVVWVTFNEPSSNLRWDTSAEWYTASCTNDVRVGGYLNQRIAPRGPGEPLFYTARYVRVEPRRLLEWETPEGQRVLVEFAENGGLTDVKQTFSADPTLAVEEQRDDWQGVLDNFAQHVEYSIK